MILSNKISNGEESQQSITKADLAKINEQVASEDECDDALSFRSESKAIDFNKQKIR